MTVIVIISGTTSTSPSDWNNSTIPLKPLVLAVAEQMAPMVVVQVVESIGALITLALLHPEQQHSIM